MIVQYKDQVIKIKMQKLMKEEFKEDENPYSSINSMANPSRMLDMGYQPEGKTIDFPTVSHPLSYPPFYWPFQRHRQHAYSPFQDPYFINSYLWSRHPFHHQPPTQFLPRVQQSNLIVKDGSSNVKLIKEQEPQQEREPENSRRSDEAEIEKVSKRYRRVNTPNYYWSLEQNKRYLEFIKSHQNLFDLSLSEKKNMKINVMMSKKVKTRNSYQCRSHHQKMMKKYLTIENLIKSMTSELAAFTKMTQSIKIQKEPLITKEKQDSSVKIQNE